MGRKKEWFETFFAGLCGQVLAGEFDEAANQRQARTLKKVLGLRRGARVLDIPCGMGRLTLPLAKMGLGMTGVDLTASYIRRAKKDAKKAGAKIRYGVGDMRDIEFDGEFDAVVNWFTSFGYFSDEDNLMFLRKARKALRPGGETLIETLNKSWLVARFRPSEKEVAGGVTCVHRRRFDSRTSRCVDTWWLSNGRRREKHTIVLCLYDAKSMRALFRKVGFQDIRFFDSATLGRFTRHSKRMIAVARRPQ